MKDYKKKLKDALDDKLVPVEVQEWIEENFPELVESEDERIRKDLIKFIKGCGAYSQEYVDWLEKLDDIDNKFIRMRETKPKDISEFLDRLTTVEQDFFWEHIAKIRELDKEEQSEQKETLCDKCKKEQSSHSCQDITELGRCAVEHEQKPTDKVEPKFHEGDWVVDKNGIVKQILSYKDGVYKHTDGYSAEIFEDEWRMWDIAKDAKDGDVLSYKDEIFIVKNSSNLNIVYYCCYDNYHFITESIYSLTIDDLIDVKPATKEERYLLFQKMKEAGYEWDAEKKELKKIEVEYAWSEEDEDVITMLSSILSGDTNMDDYADYDLQKACNWLKSLRPNRWKPTEKQMKALNEALYHVDDSIATRLLC